METCLIRLKNRFFVYYFEGTDEGTISEYSFSDTVKAHIYDDLEINFSEI